MYTTYEYYGNIKLSYRLWIIINNNINISNYSI